jgi:hypothetical protein
MRTMRLKSRNITPAPRAIGVCGGRYIEASSGVFVLLIVIISQLATELGKTMTLYPISETVLARFGK